MNRELPDREGRVSRREALMLVAGGVLAALLASASSVLRPGAHSREHARLKLGIVGLGRMGREYLRDYLQNPEVQIVAISDTDSGRRKSAGAVVGAHCAVYADANELITHPDIDAVVFATR